MQDLGPLGKQLAPVSVEPRPSSPRAWTRPAARSASTTSSTTLPWPPTASTRSGHYLRAGLVTNTCTDLRDRIHRRRARRTLLRPGSRLGVGERRSGRATRSEPRAPRAAASPPTGTLLDALLGQGGAQAETPSATRACGSLRERASEGSPGLGAEGARARLPAGGGRRMSPRRSGGPRSPPARCWWEP